MLSVEDWAEVRRLHRAERVPIKTIAKTLGASWNTVRAAVASDGAPKYVRTPVGSAVDAFEDAIREQRPTRPPRRSRRPQGRLLPTQRPRPRPSRRVRYRQHLTARGVNIQPAEGGQISTGVDIAERPAEVVLAQRFHVPCGEGRVPVVAGVPVGKPSTQQVWECFAREYEIARWDFRNHSTRPVVTSPRL